MTDTTSQTSLPYDDDDDEFLPKTLKQGRFSARRITGALVVLVVLTGVFYGGIETQKHYGKSGSSGTANARGANFPSARAGATGTAGALGTTSTAGRTIGTVKLVEGNNIYVTDTSGNVVKITTSANSTVSKTVAGAVADVQPGQSIVIQGAAGADGTIAATSLTLNPAATARSGG